MEAKPKYGRGSETNTAFIEAVRARKDSLFYLSTITADLLAHWQAEWGQVDTPRAIETRVYNAVAAIRLEADDKAAAELGIKTGAHLAQVTLPNGKIVRNVAIEIYAVDQGWVQFTGKPKGGRKLYRYHLDNVASLTGKPESRPMFTIANGGLTMDAARISGNLVNEPELAGLLARPKACLSGKQS